MYQSKGLIIAIIFIVLVPLLAVGLVVDASEQQRILYTKLEHAHDFVMSLYVHEVGYFQETPTSSKIWIAPSNIVAQLALDLPVSYPLPFANSQMELLLNRKRHQSYPVLTEMKTQFIDEANGYQLYTEVDNETRLPIEPLNSAVETLAYRGFFFVHMGYPVGYGFSFADFHSAFLSAWNGTGFVDDRVLEQRRFEVATCAMFVYLTHRIFNNYPSYRDYTLKDTTFTNAYQQIEATLWTAYDETSGGFHRYYSADRVFGQVNTETTAWALLAYREALKT
jgi:hypothetical protein